jgi:hypothetical protein
MSGALRGVISLVPVAISAWLIRDSIQGDQYETQRKVSQNAFNASFRALAVKQGQWSGYPGMEDFSDRFKIWKIYGPADMVPKVKAWYARTESFIYNVFLPNLVPIGISIASLYMGFGAKTLHAPFKAAIRWLRHTSIPASFKRQFKSFMSETAKGFGRLMGALWAMPFKSLYHFGFTLAGISMFAFFISRFQDVSSGKAQKRFFRTQLYNVDGRA